MKINNITIEFPYRNESIEEERSAVVRVNEQIVSFNEVDIEYNVGNSGCQIWFEVDNLNLDMIMKAQQGIIPDALGVQMLGCLSDPGNSVRPKRPKIHVKVGNLEQNNKEFSAEEIAVVIEKIKALKKRK